MKKTTRITKSQLNKLIESRVNTHVNTHVNASKFKRHHRLSEGRMDRFDQLDELLQFFSPKDLLNALVKAMSDSEFNDNYEYIKRMWDI